MRDSQKVFGVPMRRRKGPRDSAAARATSDSALAEFEFNPVFKFEAKVVVDDGTGEVVVHVHDTYDLLELQKCVASLESKVSGCLSSSDLDASLRSFTLGVAANVLQVSLFWMCHWAAAASFFGPQQVVPRLSSAATVSTATSVVTIPFAHASLRVSPPPSCAALTSDLSAAWLALLTIEPQIPSGWFKHLNTSESKFNDPTSRFSHNETQNMHAQTSISGTKRKARRSSRITSESHGTRDDGCPLASIAARFVSRLPYDSIVASVATLNTQLALATCTTFYAPINILRHTTCNSSIINTASSQSTQGAVVALEFICVRLYPLPYCHGQASAGSNIEGIGTAESVEADGRSVATRQVTEGPLRRLLGLNAVAPSRTLPASSHRNAISHNAAAKVTLRCLDVRPVFLQSEFERATETCRKLLAALS